MSQRNRSIVSLFLFFVGCFIVGEFSVLADSPTYSLTHQGPKGPDAMGQFSIIPEYQQLITFVEWGGVGGFFSSDNGETWRGVINKFPGCISPGIQDKTDPQVIYICCYPGPFAKSVDGGVTFKVISQPFGDDIAGWYLIQDSAGTLYLRAKNTYYWDYIPNIHLYSSNDKGEHWKKIDVKKGKKWISYPVGPFFADPEIPNLLYGYQPNPNYKWFKVSEDGGVNWKARTNGLPKSKIYFRNFFRAITQSKVPPYTLYAVVDMRNKNWGLFPEMVVYSNDRGKHWHSIKESKGKFYINPYMLLIRPETNDTLYAMGHLKNDGEWFPRLLVSQNGGKNWEQRGTIVPSEGWSSEQICGWMCPDRNMFYNGFGGFTVTKTGDIIIASDPYGFIISHDGGKTFEIHNDGAYGKKICTLIKASDGKIYAGEFVFSNGNMWVSGDNGYNWSYGGWGPSDSLQETPDGSIWGVDNSGAIWRYFQGEVTKTSDSSGDKLLIIPDGNNLKFITSSGRDIYRSDDLGKTWTLLGTIPLEDGSEPFSYVTSLLSDPRDPNSLIAGGWNSIFYLCPSGTPYDAAMGGIYRSSDGGCTWTKAIDPIRIGAVTAMYRSKDNPDILVVSTAGEGWDEAIQWTGGIFVSEDNGFTWDFRSWGLPTFPGNKMYDGIPMRSVIVSPPCGNTIFCAVQLNGGFYKSDDLGITWEKIADLPVRIPDDYIQNYLCDLTIQRTAVTQILPLCDGSDSFLASTMTEGVLLGKPETKK